MYTAHGHLDRDALIRQHAPLVRRIAQHMIAKLPRTWSWMTSSRWA